MFSAKKWLRGAAAALPLGSLGDLADELATVAAQAGNDVVDVLDSEHDAAYAERVRRGAFRLGSDRRRRGDLRHFDPSHRSIVPVAWWSNGARRLGETISPTTSPSR